MSGPAWCVAKADMNRTLIPALLSSFVCAMSLACNASSDAPPPAQVDEPPLAVEAAEPSVPRVPASTPEIAIPEVVDEPILASSVATPSPKLETEMPASKLDKPAIGGVGGSGIHLDELAVGKGWAAHRCEQLDSRFEVKTDDRVNVCFRVVHPRVAETVTVEWAREGKLRQSIDVSVQPSHRYLTRAWLPVTAGRAGEWTATVKSEDGSVLGVAEFEIVEP
jgi:hypothetical protein